VLVIRGEVLRRYPGTLVYAQRATRAGALVGLGSEQRRPVFSGRLPPDVALFGFTLTDAEVRGDGTAANPGWCFVFEEQPGDPRFGLDVGTAPAPPAATWDDLSWGHLAATPEAQAAIAYIDLASALPLRPTAEPAGGVGWQASAGPGQPIARGADHARHHVAARGPRRDPRRGPIADGADAVLTSNSASKTWATWRSS
jgi:hypothetical protein